MRKLFSILAVALFALSAHATVVTQDIDLSGFDPYGDVDNKQGTFNPSTLVYSAIPASGAGQIWIGDDNSYALDANGWSYIGLDLATAAANNVALTVEYTTTESTPSQTMEMKAGKLSQLMKLNGRYIKKIEIRNNSSVSDAEIALAKLYLFKADGVSEETILLNESRDLGNWTYDNRIVLASSFFNAVHEGDELVVTYTTGASGQCALRIQDLEDGSNYLNEAGQYANVAVNQSSPANFTVVLRESDITALKAHGLYINGNDMTVTQVKLVTYAQQFMEEYVLNVGNEAIDWSAHWEHTSVLPTLAEGDELRVTVSTVSGEYPQVNFRHNDDGDSPIIIDGINETVPKVYSVTLDATQAANINSGKLFIVGQNVTLSRFAVAKPRSIYTALYHGEKALDWDGLFFEASNFSGLTVGDRLCANVSEIGGNYPQLYFDADDTEFSPATRYAFSANNAAPMTISYPVTAEMLSLIQSKGLRVKGQHCTITEVYVQDAEPTTVSYKLPISNARMATLVLPFNVPSPLPSGVQAYNLTNNGDATIWAEEVTSLQADKPVLIIANENAEGYEFVSEEGASDDISGKAGTYRNGALVGTYQRIDPLYGDDGGANYHYILQKHDEEVAFYQVLDESCYVLPYRAYLSCGYPGNTGGSAPARMRIVFHKDGTTGVENTESAKMDGSTKFIRDGQLIILRNGVEYNANGALVK